MPQDSQLRRLLLSSASRGEHVTQERIPNRVNTPTEVTVYQQSGQQGSRQNQPATPSSSHMLGQGRTDNDSPAFPVEDVTLPMFSSQANSSHSLQGLDVFADNDGASWLSPADGWQNSDFDFGESLLSQGEEFPGLMESMDDFTDQLLKAADSNENPANWTEESLITAQPATSAANSVSANSSGLTNQNAFDILGPSSMPPTSNWTPTQSDFGMKPQSDNFPHQQSTVVPHPQCTVVSDGRSEAMMTHGKVSLRGDSSAQNLMPSPLTRDMNPSPVEVKSRHMSGESYHSTHSPYPERPASQSSVHMMIPEEIQPNHQQYHRTSSVPMGGVGMQSPVPVAQMVHNKMRHRSLGFRGHEMLSPSQLGEHNQQSPHRRSLPAVPQPIRLSAHQQQDITPFLINPSSDMLLSQHAGPYSGANTNTNTRSYPHTSSDRGVNRLSRNPDWPMAALDEFQPQNGNQFMTQQGSDQFMSQANFQIPSNQYTSSISVSTNHTHPNLARKNNRASMDNNASQMYMIQAQSGMLSPNSQAQPTWQRRSPQLSSLIHDSVDHQMQQWSPVSDCSQATNDTVARSQVSNQDRLSTQTPPLMDMGRPGVSRRQNTEQMLKDCGLYDATKLTGKLVTRSKEIDSDISDFKSQLKELMQSFNAAM